MKEHDVSSGIDRTTDSYTSNEWYEAISWSGLEGTEEWNKLDKKTRDIYTAIIMQEHDIPLFGGEIEEVIVPASK